MRTKEEIKNQIDKLKRQRIENKDYKKIMCQSTDINIHELPIIRSVDAENLRLKHYINALLWVLNEKN